ncbi:MAG: hypothetical protein F4Z55_16955 [Boseongicola sp. SB0667_bin_21]|nr:hypothetical protein [Boseongicola sp. SB0667_bin_21]
MVATWPAAYPEKGALLGSRAIVTVAARDVGRAIAQRIATEGAAGVGLDRAEIAGVGGIVADLADRSAFVTGRPGHRRRT